MRAATTTQLECVEHCRQWLDASGLPYAEPARAAFAQAHPVLFGNAYTVALRGYDRWLARTSTPDSVESFANYLSDRFGRWVGNGVGSSSRP
jgi:hypothetical protein